ncbi:hypothetical protein B0H19DRAFT_1074809 [Mycena capillaripes]|nr:hypothetical protein B0H19DRAFT_1074809 [Mycena capillaripes]
MSKASIEPQLPQHPKRLDVPYEFVDLILSQSIGQLMHENIEMAFQDGKTMSHSLFSTWDFLGTLAGVSTTFRATVLKLVVVAFKIPSSCESQSILPEAYNIFRSLLLFKGATVAGAVIDPQWQAPLIQAYAYYFKAKFPLRGYLPHNHRIARCKSAIHKGLALCQDAVVGLSQPLVDALHSEMEEGVYNLFFLEPAYPC